MNVDCSRCETPSITRHGPDGTVRDIQMKAANGKPGPARDNPRQ